MNKKNSRKKFKFSKYKVIRNFSVIGILMILFFSSKTNAYSDKSNYEIITVSKGQTLWEIAQNEKKNNPYFEGKEIRAIVKQICIENNLKDGIIFENQELKINVF